MWWISIDYILAWVSFLFVAFALKMKKNVVGSLFAMSFDFSCFNNKIMALTRNKKYLFQRFVIMVISCIKYVQVYVFIYNFMQYDTQYKGIDQKSRHIPHFIMILYTASSPLTLFNLTSNSPFFLSLFLPLFFFSRSF